MNFDYGSKHIGQICHLDILEHVQQNMKDDDSPFRQFVVQEYKSLWGGYIIIRCLFEYPKYGKVQTADQVTKEI